MLFVQQFSFFLLLYCLCDVAQASYNMISHHRPLRKGEKDFIDPREKKEDIHRELFSFYISSGYRPANANLHRYVVSIRTRQPTAYFGDNHFCAGVIITSRVIITSAHCVVDGRRIVTRPLRLRVVAGSPYRLKKEQSTMEFMVSKVIPHRKFQRMKGYDIALLVLSDTIPRSNTKIKILSLAKERPWEGTKCQTLGWGQLYWDGPYVDRITYGNLSIVSDTLCQEAYGAHFTKDQLCVANPMDPFVDTCRGDSGAPLICHNKLVGIVSFSSMCSDLKPTSFTDITYYTKWILAMGSGMCGKPNVILFLSVHLCYWICK